MYSAAKHRNEASRLRQETNRAAEIVFGSNIWIRLAELHEEIATRLEEQATTQQDLQAMPE